MMITATKHRADHNDTPSVCQMVHALDATSLGEVCASLLGNRMWAGMADLDRVAREINAYFAEHPDGTARIEAYAPRGRKRRGMARGQRHVVRIKLGATCLYEPVSDYRGGKLEITAAAVQVRCRCSGERVSTPRFTTLWSAE